MNTALGQAVTPETDSAGSHEHEHDHSHPHDHVHPHDHGSIAGDETGHTHDHVHPHDHGSIAGDETGHTHDHVHPHDHGSTAGDETGHTHSHSHTHDPAEMKKIINRLARSIGHLESVKRMIENGQDCSDVLIQLAAVKSEINGAGKALLKEHLEHCIVEAVEEQDHESIEKVNQAIDTFIR